MRYGMIPVFIVASVVVLSGCSLPSSGTPSSGTTVKTGQTEVSVGDGGVSVKTDAGQANLGGDSESTDTTMTTKAIKKNVVIIFDASGSMNSTLSGEKKIDIAKRSVGAYIDSLSAGTNLSVLAYGQVGSNSVADKTVSCNTIEEKYYFGPVNGMVAKEKVNAIPAKGWTPISKALDKADTILAAHPGEDNRIVLVSDGEETCGGDPIAMAQKIKASRARVDVVGFDVTGTAAEELKNISVQGGGGYISIKSADDFSVIIKNGTLETITPDTVVNIGSNGMLDIKTDAANIKMDGGSLDVKTDGVQVKTQPGSVPSVTVPKVTIPSY